MNPPARRKKPLILFNAIKLHQGPYRLPTGNFQQVLHLAAELAHSPDFDFRILTDLDSHPAFAEKVGEPPLIQTGLRGNSVLAADRAVVRAVRDLQPDIYHRQSGQLPFARLDCQTVVGIADLSFMALPHPPLKRLYKELSYRWTVRRADRILCISRFTRDDVARRLKVDAAKLRVVHLGANILPPADPSLAGKIVGRYFVAFGHQTHKNVELCLRALASLGSGAPEAQLALVGRNDYIEKSIKPLVRDLGVETKVHFVGAPSAAQLAGLYRRAEGLLFPSRFEGFGLPVLEAMGQDCPVICSNVCSLPEVAGEAAIQLDPDDLSGWVDTMRRLMTDSRLRTDLIEAGRLQVGRFSWKLAAQATETVYRDLLSSPTNHPAGA